MVWNYSLKELCHNILNHFFFQRQKFPVRKMEAQIMVCWGRQTPEVKITKTKIDKDGED